VGAARVVEAEGRVAARERDLAHRHAEVGPRAGDVDLAGNRGSGCCHLGPPFAGINQVRFMRSAAVAALSARFPELPRLWAVVLKVGYARFRTLATSVAASLSQCYSRSFSGNGCLSYLLCKSFHRCATNCIAPLSSEPLPVSQARRYEPAATAGSSDRCSA